MLQDQKFISLEFLKQILEEGHYECWEQALNHPSLQYMIEKVRITHDDVYQAFKSWRERAPQ